MTINSRQMKIGLPYQIRRDGEEWTGYRYTKDALSDLPTISNWPPLTSGGNAWMLFHRQDEANVRVEMVTGSLEYDSITPLVPARPITLADLPSLGEIAKKFRAGRSYRLAAPPRFVLDAVVTHLNERGGLPDDKREESEPCEQIAEGSKVGNFLDFGSSIAGKPYDWAGKHTACCEDAEQSRAEVDRLTRLHDCQVDVRAALNRELNTVQRSLNEFTERAVQAEAERDELQAELDAAEQRPTLDREALDRIIELNTEGVSDYQAGRIIDEIMALVPAVPSWLGDVPDKPEVKRVGPDWYSEKIARWCGADAGTVRSEGYQLLAIADAIEAEEAATNDDENSRCTAVLNVAGEHYRCELTAPHKESGHSNAEASALWDGPAVKEGER